MFIVIGFMFAGMLTGYVFKNRQVTWVGKLITVLIWLLLFLLGVEVGGNQMIMSGLHTIGIDALIITVGAVLGSVIGARLLWNWINRGLKRRLTHERKLNNCSILYIGHFCWVVQSYSLRFYAEQS